METFEKFLSLIEFQSTTTIVTTMLWF